MEVSWTRRRGLLVVRPAPENEKGRRGFPGRPSFELSR